MSDTMPSAAIEIAGWKRLARRFSVLEGGNSFTRTTTLPVLSSSWFEGIPPSITCPGGRALGNNAEFSGLLPCLAFRHYDGNSLQTLHSAFSQQQTEIHYL